jgi:hypothetical protein
MTGRPQISRLPIWERHERRIIAVLREALKLLAEDRPSGGEPELNRALYEKIQVANGAIHSRGGDAFDYPPAPEAKNPPSPDHPERLEREHKIPDFNWSLIDHTELDQRRAAKHFVIECKRLGKTSEGGWRFNRRYIDDGVQRFVDPAWGYGMGVKSGAMVGYVESMTLGGVLSEVNAAASAHMLPELQISESQSPLHELEHTFERAYPFSPYRLIHLWIESPPP